MVILTNFPPPAEGIRHQQNNTAAHVEGKNMGNGTLYIAESRVSWVSTVGNHDGFSLEYPAISLHAVSKDLSAFPHECLYLMVEGDLRDSDNRSSSSEEEIDPPSKSSEVRFVPDDKNSLQPMYQAMCDCQALHPDEEQSEDEDEDGDGGFFEDAEDASNLTPEGMAQLQRLEGLMVTDEGVGAGDAPRPGHTQNGNTESMDTEDASEGQFDDAE